jgi:hypothetical protein
MRRTPAQIQASRQNGKHSRGPITPEGKANSRANAVTHVFSSTSVFPAHVQQDIDFQTRTLTHQYRPQTPDEDRIVHLAAVAAAPSPACAGRAEAPPTLSTSSSPLTAMSRDTHNPAIETES